MSSDKPQIVFIHGGDSFATKEQFHAFLRSLEYDPYAPERKRWRDDLKTATSETHEFIYLAMPNKLDAEYEAWSIWFEKLVPFLREGAILIGHSLGGGFLYRYLTEHVLPITLAQVHIVAGVLDNIDCEGVGGFKIDLAAWSGFATAISAVHLWHSSDDTLVPLHHAERFKAAYPQAVLHTFTDRGHFLEETFPELVAVIKGE